MKLERKDPFGETVLGLELGPQGDGTCEFHLRIQERHMNPHGVVHGSVTYSLVDNSLGTAVYSTMDETELCAAIEIKIVYLAPVREGTLVCGSRVINRGKRVATLDSDVTNDGKLVAKALGTFAVFARRPD